MPEGVLSGKVGKIDISLLRIGPRDKVLDVGCSVGAHSRPLARFGCVVRGLDNSVQLVHEFNARADQEGLDRAMCFAHVGDATALPYATSSFAAVLLIEVLEHVQNTNAVLSEVSRVLRPGGHICLAVPTKHTEELFSKMHPGWFMNSGHVKVFATKELLALLLECGFRIVAVKKENFEWSLFWVLHCLARSPFDFTGTPLQNHRLTRLYWKAWRVLDRLHIGYFMRLIGNKVFPKSVYVYCQKV